MRNKNTSYNFPTPSRAFYLENMSAKDFSSMILCLLSLYLGMTLMWESCMTHGRWMLMIWIAIQLIGNLFSIWKISYS